VDFAIATEPTELKLVNAHKGTASVRIAARGRACHSSDPSQGDNAIVRLAGAITALDALVADLLANKRHAELGPATLCVSLVAGGQAHNIVPDRAWLVMDRRTLPGETAAEIQAEVDNALSQAGVVGVEIEDLHLGKAPLHTPPHHPAVVACHRALARSGCEPELCGVAFGTDAGLFAREGIPSLVLGPGSIAQAHTDTEYVDIDQLEKMQAVFEALLEGA
jgi:acetylornithine deacetylase